MLRPSWLLAVALVGVVGGVKGQCWEHARCQDLSSESNVLECIQLCHSDLNAESPIFPGAVHLQPLSPTDQDSPQLPPAPLSPLSPSSGLSLSELHSRLSKARRSYSMEHFRWGKPAGRKRRPVKVYNTNEVEESDEELPGEMRRELDTNLVEGGGLSREGGGLEGLARGHSLQEKKDGSYKMNHFRWGGPPSTKRYGGFMKTWDESSQKPLLTLFKNVIIKDGQQKREQ